MTKNDLKPARVFEQFAKINQIPRPSKHEEQMIEYLKEFGKSHNLETVVDKTGNVIIRKPATPGYEDRETIILQSHMDMVCDKLFRSAVGCDTCFLKLSLTRAGRKNFPERFPARLRERDFKKSLSLVSSCHPEVSLIPAS